MLDENTAASRTSRAAGDDLTPVGLKLGSVRTVAAQPGDGTVQTKVMLTCSATYRDALTGKRRVVYGEKAAKEYPERVRFMLRSGLSEDERATVARSFLDAFALADGIPPNSAVVYAVPPIDDGDGTTTLDTIVEESVGERLLCGYPESLCSSITVFGSGLGALDRVFIAINMGSTTLEACVYRRGEQLSPFSTASVRGTDVDRWIVDTIEEEAEERVDVDRTTARECKERRGDLTGFQPCADDTRRFEAAVHESTVERGVGDALDRYVEEAVDGIANGFLPRLATRSVKIYKRTLREPIVLTGSMAAVPGLGEKFEDRLGWELQRDVVVTTPEEPMTAAARGAQRIAGRLIETHAY